MDRLPENTRYLVPPDLSTYARDLLRIVGVRDDQLIAFTGNEVWEFERLWFASLPPSGAELPEAVDWFRSVVWAANPPVATPTQRLYVSRRNALHCRVLNEEELLPVLARHGIGVIQTEGMSVNEQIRAFGDAKLIVAPHGAGMTNMIFAGDRTQILEIVEPQWATDGHAYVFWALSQTLGQPFSYVVGESVPKRRDSRADLRLPAVQLDRALEQIGS
jgi:capsular polysaccharide biosynthesis protein